MTTQVTFKLGGREYTSKRKSYGQHRQWRTKLKKTSVMRVFESLDGFVSDIQGLIRSIPDGGSWRDIDMGDAIGVVHILPSMVNGLLDSVDDIADLLFAYEPKLTTERKWIETNAYDEEIIVAFMEVLKLLFPIMALWDQVAGRREQETSTSLHSPNGTSNILSASGPKRKTTTLPKKTPT